MCQYLAAYFYKIKKYNKNNKVVYKANASHPLFKIIQRIVKKHLGIEEILETNELISCDRISSVTQ